MAQKIVLNINRSRFRLIGPRGLGIDLGTANTLVYVSNKGIVLREPSVVAINLHSGSIVAVGKEAREMLGRTPASIVAIRPMRGGAIADFETTRKMLGYFLNKAAGRSYISKPRVVLSIPYGTTQVEKRAVIESARDAGAKDVFLIEEPLAAAIGAGLAVEEAVGNMIVNIGGGTTEVAVISLGGIVVGRSLRTAGDALDASIQLYAHKQYRLEIGERTAEQTKVDIGYACDPPAGLEKEIRGIDLTTGLPKGIIVTAKEISEVLSEPLEAILRGVHQVFEKTPPQLTSDILDRGIILTGGGSLLNNMDLFLSRAIDLPVHKADDPMSCVVKGAGKTAEHINTAFRVALYQA
ncbi:MAG: rod shape-determining protein MreB [Bacillota bacterium]